MRKVELDDFIKSLKDQEEPSSFVNFDKNKELAYVRYHRYRFERIMNSIPPSSAPMRILDIGTTPFTFYLRQAYSHCEIYGLDRTNLMEERCKLAGIRFKRCNLGSEPVPFDDDYFDLIIFAEVLEHIFAPPSSVLKKLRRIMRKNGKLIISVPNIAALCNRSWLIFGVTPLGDPDKIMSKEWHGYGHLYEYTMKEIVSKLEGCNFRILSKEYLLPEARLLGSSESHRTNRLGIMPAIRAIYNALLFLVPSFRHIIYIECSK
jgi:SAM-dependent methyltransferase